MLNLKKLEKDRDNLVQLIRQTQLQLYHYEGALRYIVDNINNLKEGEDDRRRTDNKS